MERNLKGFISNKPAQISSPWKFQSGKPLYWTEHARFKMKQYGLSEARVKRVLRAPARIEAGIAPKTVAVMQPTQTKRPQPAFRSAEHASAPRLRQGFGGQALRFNGTSKPAGGFRVRKMNRSAKSEIWCMYQDTLKRRKIIAAWRYPGVSPVREPPPFPDDLMG